MLSQKNKVSSFSIAVLYTYDGLQFHWVPRLGLMCVFVYVCVCVCVYGYITACSLQAREKSVVSPVFCMSTVACCRCIKTSTRRGEGYREEVLDHTIIILWLLITELFKAVNYLWSCVLCFVYTEFVCVYVYVCVL